MLAAAVAQSMQFPAQKVRFQAHLPTHKTCSQHLLAEHLSQSEKSALARPTSINLVVIALVAACTHSASEHTSRLIINMWSSLHELTFRALSINEWSTLHNHIRNTLQLPTPA
jgi:hypothetical protein